MIKTSEDFRAWLVAMGKKRGLQAISQHEASRLLGYSRSSIGKIVAGRERVPRYINLACQALAADLPDRNAEQLAEGPILKVRLVRDQ